MFRNILRSFRLQRPSSWRPLFACSVAAFAYIAIHDQKVRLEDDEERKSGLQLPKSNQPSDLLKKINEKVVCDSTNIKEGQIFFVEVESQQNLQNPAQKYLVLIVRVKGKLFAVSGFCSYADQIDTKNHTQYTFEDALVFGNKLLCPHHGCAFNVETGTVQFGPAYYNLPRFFVEEKNNKVILYYPAKLPKKVRPKTQMRDLNDQKKVLIIGNDHNATIGCINALKQYDYGGQINVMHTDNENSLPYRKDLLHRVIPNFKDILTTNNWSEAQLEQLLQTKVYSKLIFHEEDWYKLHGVQFHNVNQMFRLINKRFYPYVKLLDGSKLEFDGLMIAQGANPKMLSLKNLIYEENPQKLYQQMQIKLAPNVFMPFSNKLEHKRLVTFLNKNKVSSLIVIGVNPQSLEFCESLHNSFPQIQVKVIDFQQETLLSHIYGPDISEQILKQYGKRGMQFYVKVTQIPEIQNFILQQSKNGRTFLNTMAKMKFDSDMQIKANGVVYFPTEYVGNTETIKGSKYVDMDFDKINSRLIVDPYSRTDTKRIFAAGGCSSLEFFQTLDRINLMNPNVSYEQGYVSAFNIMALNVPFHYIPVEIRQFFGKKILYTGTRKHYDTMYIMGDVKKWDFIAFYALEDDILAVSASPSRQREFQVLRETFRLQCCPPLKKIIEQQWTIPKLYKLIRKIDKSACYKEEIHNIDYSQNIPDIIWMERDRGSFVSESTRISEDDSNVEINKQGYVTEL